MNRFMICQILSQGKARGSSLAERLCNLTNRGNPKQMTYSRIIAVHRIGEKIYSAHFYEPVLC
jgi:hypothetical protein